MSEWKEKRKIPLKPLFAILLDNFSETYGQFILVIFSNEAIISLVTHTQKKMLYIYFPEETESMVTTSREQKQTMVFLGYEIFSVKNSS